MKRPNFLFVMTDTQATNMVGLTLNIAANYGGRWDIVQGVRQLAEKVQQGNLQPDQIDEEMLNQHVCMHELAPVDLVIRTGGDRKSTRLNSSHPSRSRMPSSA